MDASGITILASGIKEETLCAFRGRKILKQAMPGVMTSKMK